MLNLLVGIGAFFGISIVLTALFGTVSVLPWGLDEALQIFMVQVNMIISVLPPFATIWNVFVWGMTVKIGLVIFEYTLWIINFIRG